MEDLEELSNYAYDSLSVEVELRLWAAILLRGERHIYNPTVPTEHRNESAARLITFFAEHCQLSIRDQIRFEGIWLHERLPDVCGACFTSYGLTHGGRYRLGCSTCTGKETRSAYERLMEMHRICWSSTICEAVLAQQIYKFYSPNGDPTWETVKIDPTKY